MKKLIFLLLFCFFATPILAAEYYVYIEKVDNASNDSGIAKKGDVIAVTPVSPEHEPTRAELSRYHIIKVDLTERERSELLESDETIVDGITIRTKERKRKVDYEKFSDKKQKANIAKSNFMLRTSVKP